MKKLYKKWFALTDTGAQGMSRAAISSFFLYFSYMLPIAAISYYVKLLIDNEQPAMLTILGISAVIAVLMIIIVNRNYSITFYETYKESANLRKDIATRLKELPLSYFSRHNISDLAQTIMRDVADIEHAMSHAIPQTIGAGCYFILISIFLIIGNFKLGLVIFATLLASALCTYLSKAIQISGTTYFHQELRRNSEAFQEAIERQKDIRAYGLRDEVSKALYHSIDQVEKVHIPVELKQAIPVNIASFIPRLAVAITMIYGTSLYFAGEISLLFLLLYLVAASKIQDGIDAVYGSMAELMYIDARTKRIQEIRETPLQEGENLVPDNYDVAFSHVFFGYGEEPVIQDLSFIAKQGEVTALIGPSGCGKTTVMRLLTRLFDTEEGQITIGGQDVQKMKLDELFAHISMVFQDVTLFNTSVMENIRLGRKDATDEEVLKAAKLANCDDFVMELKDGYHTSVGENGNLLSGGQRQRISIARAFLKNADILLLDEISAALDVENEKNIQESLTKLMENKTVIIISHRMKAVEGADSIVVMEEGTAVAQGDHETLLETSPLYRRLVEKSNLTETFIY